MKMHNVFDINRLADLMKIDLLSLIKIVVISFFVLFVLFISIKPDPATCLYMGGFFITSFVFKDLHDHQKSQFFLMLSCSNLERFLSKWLLTSIGYAILFLAVYFFALFWRFCWMLGLSYLENSYQYIPIFQAELWVNTGKYIVSQFFALLGPIGKYIIFQSVVLLGASIFKNYSLVKTALILGCFFLILNLFLMVTSALIFHPFYWASISEVFLTIKGGYFTFWLFAAPVFWCATYWRIAEFELR